MGYTRATIKGISWIAGIRGITRIISIARTAILARILTPSDFGFFAIASLVLTLVELLTETGINVVLTQKKEEINKYIDTAWVVSILRGVLISMAIFIAAPFIASFFNAAGAKNLLLLISIVPLVRGFINPSVVKFTKDLQFNKEFFYRVSIFSIEYMVSIVWAIFSPSAESLVMGLIAGAMIEVFLSFILARPFPKISFEKKKFFEIIHVGKWLTSAGLLNFGFVNGDDIVVGRVLGATSLGLYDIAYRFSMLPITEVSDVIGKVTFPVYVKIAEDKNRLWKAFLKSFFVIAGVSICIASVLILFPELIIKVALGDQWASAAPILQILAIVGMFRAIIFSLMTPLYALGLQKKMTIITAVSFIGMISVIVPLVYYFGVLGAAYASLFGTIITLPYVVYLGKTIFKV